LIDVGRDEIRNRGTHGFLDSADRVCSRGGLHHEYSFVAAVD
jgi:hypothetical protein